jgi:hypothetical protein
MRKLCFGLMAICMVALSSGNLSAQMGGGGGGPPPPPPPKTKAEAEAMKAAMLSAKTDAEYAYDDAEDAKAEFTDNYTAANIHYFACVISEVLTPSETIDVLALLATAGAKETSGNGWLAESADSYSLAASNEAAGDAFFASGDYTSAYDCYSAAAFQYGFATTWANAAWSDYMSGIERCEDVEGILAGL